MATTQGRHFMWWLPEWPCIGPEIQRMECQGCRSRDADIANMQTQLEQAAIAVRGYEQTITELRQRVAILEHNRDSRLDRQGGFDTTFVGE